MAPLIPRSPNLPDVASMHLQLTDTISKSSPCHPPICSLKGSSWWTPTIETSRHRFLNSLTQSESDMYWDVFSTYRDFSHTEIISFSVCGSISRCRAVYCRSIGIGVKVINHLGVKFICRLRLGTVGVAATACPTTSALSTTSASSFFVFRSRLVCGSGLRLRGFGWAS